VLEMIVYANTQPFGYMYQTCAVSVDLCISVNEYCIRIANSRETITDIHQMRM